MLSIDSDGSDSRCKTRRHITIGRRTSLHKSRRCGYNLENCFHLHVLFIHFHLHDCLLNTTPVLYGTSGVCNCHSYRMLVNNHKTRWNNVYHSMGKVALS